MTRATQLVCRPLRNERGQSMAMVGIGLGTAVFLFLAVVAIDIGRLAFTGTEVQTLADSTAMAGAIALKTPGANSTSVLNNATVLAGGSSIDGTSASASATTGMNDACPSPPCAGITLGTFDLTTWTAGGCGVGSLSCFAAGGASPNAVLSTGHATVNNILASMLGSSTSTVVKTAIGAIGGLGGAGPNIPLALCEDAFPANCCNPGPCPAFTVPNPLNNAAWTGFNVGHSTPDITSFMPTTCSGNGVTPPVLSAGSSTIDVTNGAGSPPFVDLRCMACTLNMCTDANPCIAPVISCPGQLNGLQSVVGFAEVVIDTFHCTGGGQNGTDCPCTTSQKGSVDSVTFHTVCRTQAGPVGGGTFGVTVAGMVG